MKYLMIGIMLVGLFVLNVQKVSALTLNLLGAEVGVSYTEPITNADASTLTDLDYTTIFYDFGAGVVKAIDVPAIALSGGAAISQSILIPVIDGMEKDVSIWVTATDKTGNESVDSEVKLIRIDRLAPSAPK